jgi:predicted DNA-binding transcriptional regulator AlpA
VTIQPRRERRRGTDRRRATKRTYLTLAEFLDELDVPRSTFFRWKALGEAPRTHKLPNGQLRIRRTDFDAWFADREEPQAA